MAIKSFICNINDFKINNNSDKKRPFSRNTIDESRSMYVCMYMTKNAGAALILIPIASLRLVIGIENNEDIFCSTFYISLIAIFLYVCVYIVHICL